MKIRRRRKPIQPPRDIDALTAAETSLEEIRRQAKHAHAARIKACREDVNEFAIYIGPRLNKGNAWTQEPLHERFHENADRHPFLIEMSHPESGKCLGRGTPVLLYDGRIVPVEMVVVGDILMGPDSQPRTVISTNVGRGSMYRIIPTKGDPWICNDVHVLTLVHVGTGDVIDIPLDEYLRMPGHWKSRHKLFTSPPRASGKCALRMGFEADPIGEDDYFGFTLTGDGRFLLGDFTVTHNTSQLGIIRTLWELGNNPDLRFAIISYKADSKGTGAKIALTIKMMIESSPEVAEVFPDLMPGGKWEESIFTVRRPNFSKDPSIQVVGYKGTITGSRIDRILADDLMVLANTTNPDERAKFRKWFTGTILERMSDTGRAIFMCNAWHPKDYAHEEIKKARDDESIWHVDKVPVEVDGVWSCSFWNSERLAKERLKMSPLEIARAYYVRARDDGESPFDIKAIERAFDVRGALYEFVPYLDPAEIGGAPVVCGVDLAITTGKKSHRTAFMVGVKWPDDGIRQLLWPMSGRLRAEEIADYIVELDRRYHPIFVVENNAAQRWIFNIIELKIERDYYKALAEGSKPEPVEFPVIVPFTTNKNKADPKFGVEGLAAEIANDLWVFPQDGPSQCVATVKRLREAVEFYSRGVHTPDELMALWFMREGFRRGVRAGTKEDGSTDFDRNSQVTIIGDDGPYDPHTPPPPGEPTLGEQLFSV